VGLESNPEVLTEYAHKMGVSKCVSAQRSPAECLRIRHGLPRPYLYSLAHPMPL
jgi:hypothetical protein